MTCACSGNRDTGVITRIPRYQVTDTGLHHTLFLTRAHKRLLRSGLAELTGPESAPCASPVAPTKPPWTPSSENRDWQHNVELTMPASLAKPSRPTLLAGAIILRRDAAPAGGWPV